MFMIEKRTKIKIKYKPILTIITTKVEQIDNQEYYFDNETDNWMFKK